MSISACSPRSPRSGRRNASSPTPRAPSRTCKAGWRRVQSCWPELATAGGTLRSLGCGAGKFALRQPAVLVLVRLVKAIDRSHCPFLESEKIVPVDVELAKAFAAGRKHFIAGNRKVTVAVITKEAPLLASQSAGFGGCRAVQANSISQRKLVGGRPSLHIGRRRCLDFNLRLALPPIYADTAQHQAKNDTQNHAPHCKYPCQAIAGPVFLPIDSF